MRKSDLTFREDVSLLGFRSWSSIVRDESITRYRWRICTQITAALLQNTVNLFFFKYQMIIMSAHHSQPNLPMSLKHSTTQQVKTLNISTHRYVLFSIIHMIHTCSSLTLTSSVWTRRECPLRWLSGTRTHPPSAPP